jgi:hypothetical protein
MRLGACSEPALRLIIAETLRLARIDTGRKRAFRNDAS